MTNINQLIYIYIYIYYDDDDDDDGEMRFISHRYKVRTLLVSSRKINIKNKTQQPKILTEQS